MNPLSGSVVCITGASSGIGAACAEAFARHGAALLLLARRKDRLEELARTLSTTSGVRVATAELDVRKPAEVEACFHGLAPDWKSIDVLVNNAGLSRGLHKLHEGRLDDWEEMIDTNIKGLLYVTRAVLPRMVQRNSGHVINIGSIAGHQTYPGGNVYSATKFAVTGLSRSLKMDLLGTAVRVSSVDPGLVETEFSRVRYRGDLERAAKAYEGLTPLTPADVADVVVFCATRPPHVNIGEVILTPVDQASTVLMNRKSS
jgi:3-hydroxy acid dehydrogenase/malonic semialdehyde reductase